MKKITVLIYLTIFTIQIFAQKNLSSDLIEECKKNSLIIRSENNRLIGEGTKFLLEEAKTSQFFLIGEDHGIANLPDFTTKLFREINPFGYQIFATETGPLTANYLQKMATQPNAQKAFTDFNRQYPFGLPFYYWQEEAEMGVSIAKIANSKKQIFWGLDQEFILSSAFHFKRLIELSSNKNEQAIASEYYEKTKDEFAQIVKTRNPRLAFLTSAKPEDFDKLEKVFRFNSNKEASTILSELRESWEIYQKNNTGRVYESNFQRALLMKRHFWNYYNAKLAQQKALPKILFKFGANHIKRGRSYTNIYDIGNTIGELATANRSKSFHLFVLAVNGTQNKFLPFLHNEADKQSKIDIAKNFKPFDAEPFLEIADTKHYTVIDLRPLRPFINNNLNIPRGIADLIWGYDAILLMPNVKASKIFE